MSVQPQEVLLGGTSWGTFQFWKSNSDTWSGMFFVWGYISYVFLDFTKDFSIKLEAKKGLYRQGISQIKILGPAILVWEHIILLLFKTSIFQTKVILMIGQIRAFQQQCRMASYFDWLLFTFEWGRQKPRGKKVNKNHLSALSWSTMEGQKDGDGQHSHHGRKGTTVKRPLCLSS